MHEAHHTSGEEYGKYVEGEVVGGGILLPHQGVFAYVGFKTSDLVHTLGEFVKYCLSPSSTVGISRRLVSMRGCCWVLRRLRGRLRRLVIESDSYHMQSGPETPVNTDSWSTRAVAEFRYQWLVIETYSNCCQWGPLLFTVPTVLGQHFSVDYLKVPTISHVVVDSCRTFIGINDTPKLCHVNYVNQCQTFCR